ncbi:hypothetical protein TSOC_011878 [Tetrabaena socialis]|uniref:BACK domain-containing protein n=1 Tax=Tetrabaena socialis TaxID=47790 RepID=A0A2J7ZPH3_9CHLO|nr:hypothetical protein TSOC_011878 [Tetrabaena socialis]|eukprot:PNH02168.1 hypothetical protein TSOC_011878 [Tetrabaena socialis]
MASGVVAAIGEVYELFGTGVLSDSDLVFCLEEAAPADAAGAPADPAAISVTAVVGQPLLGHSLVLCLASERFRAQLCVPLGSETEVPFARAAIGYAYTGRVAAGSVREALGVRRQAGYLQIDGCAAACNDLLLGILEAGKVGVRTAPAPSSAAAELTECWGLMPDPVDDPSFAPVLVAAMEALVRHFGDTLAVLNTPSLRQQLLQLPAAAVEALLGSKAFGTDTEDSVLLLLATWIKANHSQTDAEARERLCQLVWLVQLSRPYLTSALLALAADYETEAAGLPCAWFPISVPEAGFIIALATAPAGQETEATLRLGGPLYDTQSPWYSTIPRPQCLSGAGRHFEWAISEQELREGLGRLKPERPVNVYGSFAGGDRLCARGFEWKVMCQVQHEATSAGCFLECAMPAAYDVPGSRLGSSSKAAATVGLEARFAVHSWGGSARQDAFVHEFKAQRVNFARLQPAGGVEVLAGWAAYLRDGRLGRLTGTLTLLARA